MPEIQRLNQIKSTLILRLLALACLLLALLVLAACGEEATNRPAAGNTPGTTAPSVPTAGTNSPVAGSTVPAGPVPTTTQASNASPGSVPEGAKAAFQAAVNDLIKRNTLPASAVQVVSITPQEFSDASLDCPDPNSLYAQVITPGFQIVLQTNNDNQTYDYRTNLAGTRLVLCGSNRRPIPRTP